MNQPGKGWHRWVIYAGLLGLLVYAIVLPIAFHLYSLISTPADLTEIKPATYLEIVNQRLIETFFAALFFFLGATIGSFLNVVAYRMPLGISVVTRPSQCPNCQQRLSFRENIPVFGWLMLKGQCRFCNQPISPRYPIVEGITGAIFLALYFVQLISGGANLPNWAVYRYSGVVWILLYTKWDMLALYAYHAILFIWLMIFTLFAWDRQPVPRKSLIVGLLMIVIPPLLLPYLSLFTFRLAPSDWQNVLVTAGIGAMAGWVAALVLKLTTGKQDWVRSLTIQEPISAAFVFTGMALGVQAFVDVAVLLVVWRVVCWVTRMNSLWKSLPLVGWWLIFTLIHHLFWRQIAVIWGA